MHYALDTNFMVYFEGVNDLERRMKARRLLDTLDPGEIAVSAQPGLMAACPRRVCWIAW